ncbi:hypothetical protein [Thermococcus stetteri]|uniref:hypothetical protein n=1 Tax=Thermococcus stetteri TaxID=49900 RepID=UPI001FD81DF6|nr:hypothetical protein [Thermococcus stetteri]MBP1912093.1 putative membrane protein [Thermococcus stetteri]
MHPVKTQNREVSDVRSFTNAFIAYVFGFVGGIPLILMKDTDEFTKKHAAYSSVMGFFAWLAFMALWHMPMVNPNYPHFGPAIYVAYAWFLYALFGIYTYMSGRLYRIPGIEGLAEKLIKGLSNAV